MTPAGRAVSAGSSVRQARPTLQFVHSFRLPVRPQSSPQVVTHGILPRLVRMKGPGLVTGVAGPQPAPSSLFTIGIHAGIRNTNHKMDVDRPEGRLIVLVKRQRGLIPRGIAVIARSSAPRGHNDVQMRVQVTRERAIHRGSTLTAGMCARRGKPFCAVLSLRRFGAAAFPVSCPTHGPTEGEQ